jgi:prevent-host-death family protein
MWLQSDERDTIMPVTQIGVRELKNQATEIIREVREQHAEYIVTYRDRPVARLAPLAPEGPDAQPAKRASPQRVELEALWAEWDALAQEIDEHWQGDKSVLETLLEMRREREESLAHPGSGLAARQYIRNGTDSWADWGDLREEIGGHWYTDRTAAEAVAEQRR